MTYAVISVPFLVVGVVAAVLAAGALPAAARRPRWIATGIAGLVLLVLTAVFDTVMIAAGFFGYADGTRLGPAIGLAPIEDFAYPVVAVLVVPAVWTLARARARRGADDED